MPLFIRWKYLGVELKKTVRVVVSRISVFHSISSQLWRATFMYIRARDKNLRWICAGLEDL